MLVKANPEVSESRFTSDGAYIMTVIESKTHKDIAMPDYSETEDFEE